MRTTPAVLALAALAALAACGDSTDISGSYTGNATYTVSPASGAGSVGAGSATIAIANAGDDIDVTLALGCELYATQLEQDSINDHGATSRFVFTSDTIDAGATCTLPIAGGDLALTVFEGDVVALKGPTVTIELGGSITAAPDPAAVGGYAVYDFAGAQ